MRPLQSRPRFQAPTRHYHRSRAESPGGWDAWVDPTKKPGSRRRWLWISGTLLVLAVVSVMLLFRFGVL